MVRFIWTAGSLDPATNTYPTCSIDSMWAEGGCGHLSATLTIPQAKASIDAIISLSERYMDRSAFHRTGIFLMCGTGMGEFKGRLSIDLAIALACQGHVVFRVGIKASEALREEAFLQSLALAAAAPYWGSAVDRWVLMSQGPGARILCQALDRAPGKVSGLVLSSFPVTEDEAAFFNSAMPEDRARIAGNSLLARASRALPTVVVLGEKDEATDLTQLLAYLEAMDAGNTRLYIAEGLDVTMKPPKGAKAPAGIHHAIVAVVRSLMGMADRREGRGEGEGGEELPGLSREEGAEVLRRAILERSQARQEPRKRGRRPKSQQLQGTEEDEEEGTPGEDTGAKKTQNPAPPPSSALPVPHPTHPMAPAFPPAQVLASIPPSSVLQLGLAQLQQLQLAATVTPAQFPSLLQSYGITPLQLQTLLSVRMQQAQQQMASSLAPSHPQQQGPPGPGSPVLMMGGAGPVEGLNLQAQGITNGPNGPGGDSGQGVPGHF